MATPENKLAFDGWLGLRPGAGEHRPRIEIKKRYGLFINGGDFVAPEKEQAISILINPASRRKALARVAEAKRGLMLIKRCKCSARGVPFNSWGRR